ncbi:MAG: hypothetical protein IKH90_08010 [Ruminococcus sp.]|nr:hypothetical protein [Ruminococcus sp.]
MKPNSKKRSANKSGAVLVTAVCVLLIMSILMSATIGYVAVNRKKTNSNYSRKQAYLTASTTLKGFVEKIRVMTGSPQADGSGPEGTAKNVAEQLANIKAIQALAAEDDGKGTEVDVTYNGSADQPEYKIGTTKLRISQDNGSTDNLVLTCTTTYGDETEKVAAHISTATKKKPARFTNTIEWMGKSGLDINNLNVVGDTAVLDQGDLKKVYHMTNDVKLQGSLYIWGSMTTAGTGGNSLDLYSNILDNSRGSFVQVSGNWGGDIKAKSYKKGNDGYNYIYIGGTADVSTSYGGGGKVEVGSDGYDVDIITHCVKMSGNEWTQTGNVYVYKNNVPDAEIINDGSFVLNDGHVNINGDVFIEGDLIINKGSFTCNNLNVAGAIVGKEPTVSGTKNVGASAKIEKSGRGSEPTMEINSSTYKYMPEDFFMNNDNVSSANFAEKYANFYNGKNTYDLLNDSPSYTDPDTGAKFNYHVEQSCTFSLDFDKYGKNGAMKNNKGVPWDKDYIILVEVNDSTGDVLIRLRDGVVLGGNGKNCEIVVRNRSTKKPATLGDGTEVMEHQFNCYFVSDSGNKIAFTGKDKAGVSQHTGSTPGAFEFHFMNLFDYDTYVNMLKPEYYQNGNRSPQNAKNYVRSDFYFNPTRDETLKYKDATGNLHSTFCPGSSSIIFLIGDNFSLGCKYDPEKGKTNAQAGFIGNGQANAPFIQATVYAPQGAYAPKTQQLTFNVVRSDGGLYNPGKPIQGVGVFIASAFNNKETSTYVYTEPSGSSVLANAKGDKEGNITGFELDRYDHY